MTALLAVRGRNSFADAYGVVTAAPIDLGSSSPHRWDRSSGKLGRGVTPTLPKRREPRRRAL
jgi:hypothetical protein